MSTYRILVPSGIGDFSWLWSKISTTPHNFHIEYIGGTPDRMAAFLEILPQDRIVGKISNPHYFTKWEKGELICVNRQPQLYPSLKKAYRFSDLVPDQLYFIENNSWLEAGNRLEEWNKEDLPATDFHYPLLGVCDTRKEDYFVVNFSSYGTKKAWGYYEVTDSAEVVESLFKMTGWKPLFIGGTYDDYTKDIYENLKNKIPCISLVGHTPDLKDVVQTLQQSQMYFGACSGLMVLTNILRTPVATYYPPFDVPPGRKLAGTWHDPAIPYLSLFWEGKDKEKCLLENFIKKIK